MIGAILSGLGGYLLGSFPSAIAIGRLWGVADIRKRGSTNPGAANALRVLGPLPGALVLFLDCGKGLAASLLAAALFGPDQAWLAGLAAVAGHIYPVFAGFRGGKGLATGCGVVLYLYPWALVVFAPIWAGIYLARRQVPPASAAAIAAVAISAPFFLGPWPAAATCLGCALIFLRHWPEAKRQLMR